MISQGTYPISVVLFEDAWPLARASQTGKLTLDADNDAEVSVWDLFELMGSKRGCGSTSNPNEEGEPSWIVVLVNSLKQPLTLDALWLNHGTQQGFPAATDFTTMVEGTEDQVPGVRDHPSKPGVALTAAGVWTFIGSPVDLAMKFTHKTSAGDPAKTIGVALECEVFWIHPACAVTTDLEKFRKAPSDTDAVMLEEFSDERVGNQDEHYEIGDETTVWGRVGGANENCLVVWVR